MRIRIFIIIFFAIFPMMASSQSLSGYYYNEEYQLYLRINAEKKDIIVPGQDIYGELAGYFGTKRDGRLWLITEIEYDGNRMAEISVINDYGSEDFTATLTENNDHEITMRHKKGSTFKIVVNNKYVKIPKEIKLKWKEQ